MSYNASPPKAHAETGHPMPLWLLVATILALLVLTFLTVGATWVNFGPTINLWIALVIATVKAVLVALFFMHLAYEKPFNAVILIAALAFVMLFVIFAMMDSAEYRQNIQDYRDVDPTRYAPLIQNK